MTTKYKYHRLNMTFEGIVSKLLSGEFIYDTEHNEILYKNGTFIQRTAVGDTTLDINTIKNHKLFMRSEVSLDEKIREVCDKFKIDMKIEPRNGYCPHLESFLSELGETVNLHKSREE